MEARQPAKKEHCLLGKNVIISTSSCERIQGSAGVLTLHDPISGTVSYSQYLRINDKNTLVTIRSLLAHLEGIDSDQKEFYLSAHFPSLLDRDKCSNILIKRIHHDSSQWYITGEYIFADV